MDNSWGMILGMEYPILYALLIINTSKLYKILIDLIHVTYTIILRNLKEYYMFLFGSQRYKIFKGNVIFSKIIL